MPHVIVSQAENNTQDLHWNLPNDWLVHNTLSGYMDRDGWMKSASLFSRTCGDRKLNIWFLLFDGHYRNFDDRDTHLLQSHHISPFILKTSDSTNDHQNDNGPNLKMKRYYILAEVKWQRQHGTMKFTAYHMNYVLVDMWHSFQHNQLMS